eukprot:TRINITY_DN45298_c0_g1_i1.p2 TRINITY_DN45298_c0_g1~~TRINITY_DN45298_c0_g1_i1.p2  ORF type:complete len:111 (+),score=25.86 TRINITY_DN45298_c0_g1_i1:98-430(+)
MFQQLKLKHPNVKMPVGWGPKQIAAKWKLSHLNPSNSLFDPAAAERFLAIRSSPPELPHPAQWGRARERVPALPAACRPKPFQPPAADAEPGEAALQELQLWTAAGDKHE